MRARTFGSVFFLLIAGCVSDELPETRFEPSERCPPGDEACFVRVAGALAAFLMGETRAAEHLSGARVTHEEVPASCLEHPGACTFQAPRVHVLYAFRAEGAPWVDETIEVILRSNDSGVDNVGGIPYCRSAPRECSFRVDEPSAVEIARREGLAEGVEPWRTSFHFYHGESRELRTFVWTVTNTDPRGGADDETYVIDANDGKLLQRSQWASFD